MRKVLKVLGALVAVVVLFGAAGVAWLALRSPAMRPAATETVERTPERIERGRYLVEHVADCVGCHSDHLWDRWAMPVKPGTRLQGGLPFDEKLGVPGVVCAQNLTPDPETGKGTWTDGELIRAIREGVSRDGKALFPMMPYAAYRSMSDEDVRAVVAYIRTLPPVKNPIPPVRLDFPVNLLIKFAPRPVDGPVATPDDEKDHLGYGKYLVNLAGCMDCHTPKDDKGQMLPGREYAGGWELVGPWGKVVTPNITPDPETSWMGTATKEQFISRFKSYAGMTPETAPPAVKGKNTVMAWPAFAGMTEKDLGAIYDYLKTIRPMKNKVVVWPDAS